MVRLRGLIKVKAGKELAAGGEICTLSAAFRPLTTIIIPTRNILSNTALYLRITSAGLMTNELAAVTEQIALDGITFSIT